MRLLSSSGNTYNCDYQGVDVMGGWVSDVIVAFVFDALFVAGLLLISAWQARRSEIATVGAGGRPG